MNKYKKFMFEEMKFLGRLTMMYRRAYHRGTTDLYDLYMATLFYQDYYNL